MKRLVAIILFFLYVMPAIGINISVHYCGGQLSSVAFGSEHAEKCACGTKKMTKDCCKDKKISVKLKSDQYKTTHETLNFSKSFSTHPLAFHSYTIPFQPAFVLNRAYNDYSPPDNLKQALYLLNRVLRI